MELTQRLAAVAEFVPPGVVVADIGTDHAYLPVYLVQTGKCPRVIATDLNEKPYQSARLSVAVRELGRAVDVRLGDGLHSLSPGEAEVVVIAGMGGGTMIRILESSPGVLAWVRRLVLQPMADAGDLRLWLADNGWRIAGEKLVEEEGRIYPVLAAEPGVEGEKDRFRLEVGPRLVEDSNPLLVTYLEKIKSDYQRMLCGLARSRSGQAREKAIKITAKLSKVRELLSKCKQSAN